MTVDSVLGHLGPLQGAEKNFLLLVIPQKALYLKTGLPRM